MADTEFSGDLMECDGVACNPCYHQVTHIVMVIPATTDKAVVDYLVHGKDTLRRVYDVALGDLPYHCMEKTEEQIKDDGIVRPNILNPKWYNEKAWNELMVAMRHKVPATCSMSKQPSHKIIHTAPTHERVDYKLIHIAPELISSVVFETSDMVESIPLVTKKTSEMVFKSSEQPDNPCITPVKTGNFSEFDGVDIMNAKLKMVEKMIAGKGNNLTDVFGEEITGMYEFRIGEICAHLDAQINEEQKLTGKRPERIGWSYTAKTHKFKDALGCSVDRFENDDPTSDEQFKKVYIIKNKSMGTTSPLINRLVASIAQSRDSMKKGIDTAYDIYHLKGLLTSEPQFACDVAKKAGWSVQKTSKLLKRAMDEQVVKSVPLKNGNRKILPAYFI